MIIPHALGPDISTSELSDYEKPPTLEQTRIYDFLACQSPLSSNITQHEVQTATGQKGKNRYVGGLLGVGGGVPAPTGTWQFLVASTRSVGKGSSERHCSGPAQQPKGRIRPSLPRRSLAMNCSPSNHPKG